MNTISLGVYNPNQIKNNPIQKEVKAKHIRVGRTKTKQEKLNQLARQQKQKGWC